MDSTVAAEPATFCAMSWMTVNVVTTRNGFLDCATAFSGAARAAKANASAPPTNLLMTMDRITLERAQTRLETFYSITILGNHSQLGTWGDSRVIAPLARRCGRKPISAGAHHPMRDNANPPPRAGKCG